MTGYSNQPIPKEAAKQLLALDLQDKEILSYEKIDQWYTAWNGRCYVSFSGGKDSTVLAYLVARYLSSFRTPPWALTLVFVNTGLEYPEIQKFVNTSADWLRREFPRVAIELVRLRPKMNVRQVVRKYGYPVVSKVTSFRARKLRYQHLTEEYRADQMERLGKWAILLRAPFRVSEQCCDVMKKAVAQKYEHSTDRVPMTAIMGEESFLRMERWLKTGCNAFEGKRPMGKPMSFWTEQDVLRFIVDREIPIASVYGDIVASDGENDYNATLIDCKLHCTGCQRTGCMFCAFGAHLEKGENRFERMKHTHPKHYEFCIGGGEWDTDGLWKPNEKGLGYGRVLDYIGVRY